MKLPLITRAGAALLTLMVVAHSRMASAADQTLGGVAAEGELQVIVTDSGAVRIARHNGSVYQNFWYSGNSVGSRLRYDDGTVRAFRGGSFFTGGATAMTTTSNITSGNTVTTIYQAVQGADTIGITQTTSYTSGQNFVDVTWVFTNNYATTINDLRWFFGGDTFLLGDDNGTGFFSSSTGNGRVGVNKPGATGEFSIEGITPHFGYDALNYSVVNSNGQNGALTNQVISTVADVGMAMEWRLASLAPTAIWTVQMRLRTTMTFATPTPTFTATPTATSIPEATATPTPPPTAVPDVPATEAAFEVSVDGKPISDALVYLPEAGTCLTNAEGKCSIRNLEAGRSYQAYIQKTGVQFSTASFSVLAGQEVQVDGTEVEIGAEGCDEKIIAARLHKAASAAVSLRDLATEDNTKRSEERLEGTVSQAATSATKRVTDQLMNYLGASRGIPEVVLSCQKSSGCTKTRISGAVSRTMKQLGDLMREGQLANRILRDEYGRTNARAERRAELIRKTGRRAARTLKSLPSHTWTCPQD